MFQKSFLMLAFVGFVLACSFYKPPAIQDACPVTTPTEQTIKLPTTTDYENRFWYGTPALWTNLPNNGIWHNLPQDDNGYVQKTVFWREGFVAFEEPNPDLTVSGRKLDASAPTFSFSDATHGWDDTGNFMLIGISIPAEGCWEITAEYKDAQLTYVVEVIP
jgi:hypothetical protein